MNWTTHSSARASHLRRAESPPRRSLLSFHSHDCDSRSVNFKLQVNSLQSRVERYDGRMTKRYDRYCPMAHALDLVGERWALLVVLELMHGPKRYTDLADSLPGIGTNILASRLRDLEAHGIVTRRTLPPPAASRVYELTEYGREPAAGHARAGAVGRSLARSADRRRRALRRLAVQRRRHRARADRAPGPVRVPGRRRGRLARRRRGPRPARSTEPDVVVEARPRGDLRRCSSSAGSTS